MRQEPALRTTRNGIGIIVATTCVLMAAACGGEKAVHDGALLEVDLGVDAGPPDEMQPDYDADAGLWGTGDGGAGEVPVPGDEGDGDGAGDGDEGAGAGSPECPCVEDTIRYCDSPAYCAWGAQVCEIVEGIHRWSGCEEDGIPPGCDPWGALAESYEWHYAGGYWDGQVDDPDGDGVLVSDPDWWLNPAAEDCAIRAGLCVQDAWDLDLDGDVDESIGNCQRDPACDG